MNISSLTKEYIRVEVEATDSGVQVDPTGTPPEFSFEDFDTDPEPTAWTAGEWETVVKGTNTTYYARILVGTTGATVVLVDGKYYVWLKVTSSPEVPVRKVGSLNVE